MLVKAETTNKIFFNLQISTQNCARYISFGAHHNRHEITTTNSKGKKKVHLLTCRYKERLGVAHPKAN